MSQEKTTWQRIKPWLTGGAILGVAVASGALVTGVIAALVATGVVTFPFLWIGYAVAGAAGLATIAGLGAVFGAIYGVYKLVKFLQQKKNGYTKIKSVVDVRSIDYSPTETDQCSYRKMPYEIPAAQTRTAKFDTVDDILKTFSQLTFPKDNITARVAFTKLSRKHLELVKACRTLELEQKKRGGACFTNGHTCGNDAELKKKFELIEKTILQTKGFVHHMPTNEYQDMEALCDELKNLYPPTTSNDERLLALSLSNDLKTFTKKLMEAHQAAIILAQFPSLSLPEDNITARVQFKELSPDHLKFVIECRKLELQQRKNGGTCFADESATGVAAELRKKFNTLERAIHQVKEISIYLSEEQSVEMETLFKTLEPLYSDPNDRRPLAVSMHLHLSKFKEKIIDSINAHRHTDSTNPEWSELSVSDVPTFTGY